MSALALGLVLLAARARELEQLRKVRREAKCFVWLFSAGSVLI